MLLATILTALVTLGAPPRVQDAEFDALFAEGRQALGAVRFEEAIDRFERCLELRPEQPRCAYYLTVACAGLGEADATLQWATRALYWGESAASFRQSSSLAPLHADPRWAELLAARAEVRVERLEERVRTSRDRMEELERRAEEQPIEWRDGHVGAVWHAEQSADGERVVTAASDDVGRLWDTHTGECLALLEGHDGLGLVTFGADGERILTAGDEDGTARLWDGHSGELVAAFDPPDAIVTAAVFGPEGRLVLLGHHTGSIEVVDSATGEPVWSRGGGAPVTSAVFRPDGTTVALGREDGTIEVRSARTGEGLAELAAGPGVVLPTDWSPDGRRLVSVDRDGWRATLWDARTFEPVARLQTSGFVSAVRFAGRGRAVLSTGSGQGHVWDGVTGELLHELGDVRVYGAQGSARRWSDVSPDGERLLVVRRGGRAELLDLATGDLLGMLEGETHSIRGVSFSTDGERILTTGGGYTQHLTAGLWDGRTGAHLADLRGHEDTLHWGEFSRDGERAVTTAGDGRAIVWHAESGEPLAVMGGHLVEARGVDVAADGVVAVARGDATTRTWSPVTGEQTAVFASRRIVGASQTVFPTTRVGWHGTSRVRRKILIAHGTNSVSFDRAGTRLATGGMDGALLWNRATGEALSGYPKGAAYWTTEIALNPAGDRVALLGHRGDSVLWDVTTGAPAANLGTSLDFEALQSVPGSSSELVDQLAAQPKILHWCERGSFDPTGERFVLWGELTVAFVVDGRTGAPRAVLAGHEGALNHVEWSADGARLLTASDDGSAAVWSAEDGVRLARFEGHEAAVEHAAFGPEGKRVLTGSRDGRVGLWDAESGERLSWFEGHRSFVGDVAISPDGKLGLSCSANYALYSGQELAEAGREDSRVLVWDLERLADEPLAVLGGDRGDVDGARFSPDGRTILASGWGHTLRAWSAETFDLLAVHVGYTENDWLTFEPGGHYVAAGRAADWAQVRVDGAVYPLSSYAELLERPDRVVASLAGERVKPRRLPAAPTLVLVSHRPGTNVVQERTFEVRAAAADRSGLDRIAVEVDGEAVDEQVVKKGLERGSGSREMRLALSLSIPEGRDAMVVSLQAVNRRGVRGRKKTFEVRYEPERRELYLLALGVQDYEDDELDLAYPRNDVDRLVTRFESESGRLYDRVHVARLVDGEVTGPALKRLRETFLRRAQPTDTIVVFVAGHGVRSESGEYYFLTSRATPADPFEGVERSLLESLVTWDKLYARRRVLLIDTCHSGDAFGEGKRGIEVEASFGQSEVDEAAGSGLYIIAASAERGFAVERDGNGLFTSALLQGLDGAADRDGDGLVEIEELKEYASTLVHEESGGRQRPTVPRVVGGEDFPLARVPE